MKAPLWAQHATASGSLILGVDPGLKGALAFLDPESGMLEVFDMPKFRGTRGGKDELDRFGLAAIVRERAGYVRKAVVELVGAMPKQGVASTFVFGKGTGVVLGVLAACGIRTEEPHPGVWKRAMGVTADKETSRKRAIGLWPHCPHLFGRADRAEAALLAYYGTKTGD
jgi:hypothetical protein